MPDASQNEDIAQLIGVLASGRWHEREQAISAIVRIGEPAVLPTINALERDPSELLMRVLGELRDGRAVKPLTAALKQKSPHMRQAAATALGLIGDPRGIGPLINAFSVESGDIEDITAWMDAARALARIGTPAIHPLIEALSDEDAKVRAGSADALGQLGNPSAVAPLIGALLDEDVQVRLNATDALGKIGDPAAIEAIVTHLGDPKEDKNVRTYAARALGHLVRGGVFAPLVEALNDPEIDVRCQALYALAESAGAKSVDLLLDWSTDPNTFIRHAAVHGLGKVGDERQIPYLEWVTQHDQGELGRAVWVREAARAAIETIRTRHDSQPT